MKIRRAVAALAAVLGTVLVFGAGSALAAGGTSQHGDVILGTKYGSKLLPVAGTGAMRAAAPGASAAAAEVGDVKTWLALNDVTGGPYLKEYRLRAIGTRSEVWVALDLDFPAGDCRNGEGTTITDGQVQYFVQQFDDNMYPKESAAFSTPQPRDGSGALLPGLVGLPDDYYVGDPGRIVILIDNVRDENYYDLEESPTYIAGFFWTLYTLYFDRNVMTVDAYDWLHRTGATPPDEPVPGDLCASRPARPFLYEGVFAHEYQHLLESDADPDEVNWVNEGLSDWAITLTGYQDPTIPITDTGFSSHIQCFLGWSTVQTAANPNPRPGGPENSLTWWGDKGDDQILCDYGAGNSIMELLHGRYGDAFMSALHNAPGNGLEGLQDVLDDKGVGTTSAELLHDWSATMALDAKLDSGVPLIGGDRSRYRTPTLAASINWANPDAAAATPGAPPNGSDYVRFASPFGSPLIASQVRSIEFKGATSLDPDPVEWTVDQTPPDTTDGLPDGSGDAACDDREGVPTRSNPAFHSGCGPDLDRGIVLEATVPDADPTLRFSTLLSTEETWDYAFVQVSTDGGKTYTSLPEASGLTDTAPDPVAIPAVQSNLPGLTGISGGWIDVAFDLTAYKGQKVLIAFRYVTDSFVDLPGWWVDDVTIGATALSDGSSLNGWRSPTEVFPTPVGGWTLQLVSLSDRTISVRGREITLPFPVWIATIPVDGDFKAALDRIAVIKAIGLLSNTVALIVTYDDPSETSRKYARYELRVNGVLQAGG
ncbi:MAG: peptidase M6 [Gaiellaceae bacterium]